MSTERPANFPWRVYWLLFGVIVMFALAPILSALFSGLLAEVNGCTLTEHDMHPCVVGDMEFGGIISFFFVLGLFALATLPLGGGALIVWLATLIIHRIAWGQMQKAKTP